MRRFLLLTLLSAAFAGLGACRGSPETVSGEVGSSSSSGGAAGSSSGSSSGGSVGNGSGSGSGSSSGTVTVTDGGTDVDAACPASTDPINGSVGNSGGSISRLVFAVAGDTRPAVIDDTSSYPTAIITKIFQDIEALTPRPALVLGTGDYQFSSTGSSATGSQQVDLYMQTRALYSGPYFPAMGNHECGTSGPYITSDNNNCGPGNPGGVTPNYTAFMSQMLAPISQANPYYSINVNATDGSWTAKFVITAANAWTTAQQTWLETMMAQPTTYTFVVRHEGSEIPPLPPGVAGVDAVLAQYPYTLLIVGHIHNYGHYANEPQVVIFGNGGAPLQNGDYGFGLFSQRCDGAIVVDAIDYDTGAADSSFHFVITPQGTITN
jgi:hypothetical protein